MFLSADFNFYSFRVRSDHSINKALIESPENFGQSDFSEYLDDDSWKISDNFRAIAEDKDIEGLEAVLDEVDRRAETEDKIRLQHALLVFLAENRTISIYGLRIPSLEERSPWNVLPSRRDPNEENN